MGLGLEVGGLKFLVDHDAEGAKWFRKSMRQVSGLLVSSGLSPHTEPMDCPDWSADMLGYSGLHYLRRLAAHLNLRGLIPEPGDDGAPEDPVLFEYYSHFEDERRSTLHHHRRMAGNSVKRQFDHLMLHSDAEGYYVPQDFEQVLLIPDDLKLAGWAVGSSHRLLRETEMLAEALQLPLELDPESEEVWEAPQSQGQGAKMWHRYGIESFTCLRLHHGARHSIEHSAVLRFI